MVLQNIHVQSSRILWVQHKQQQDRLCAGLKAVELLQILIRAGKRDYRKKREPLLVVNNGKPKTKKPVKLISWN